MRVREKWKVGEGRKEVGVSWTGFGGLERKRKMSRGRGMGRKGIESGTRRRKEREKIVKKGTGVISIGFEMEWLGSRERDSRREKRKSWKKWIGSSSVVGLKRGENHERLEWISSSLRGQRER